ncbi:MAG: matrixin family metalloprotease [Fimbriimonadaceae bacterium]
MIAAIPFALALLAPTQNGWAKSDDKSTVQIPYEVHDAVVKSLQEALEAQSKRDYQLSLALLHGVIYNDGVSISVAPETPVPTSAAKDGINRALQTWASALTGDDPIKFTSNSDKADVLIKFVDKVPESGNDALGLIKLKKQYRWNKSRYEIEISGTIYIQTHYERTPLNAAQYNEVIAHELGHLLGLDDMPNTGQLMGPMIVDKPVSGPNQRETYAVQFVRNQAKKQWNSVLENIKQDATHADSSNGYYLETNYLASCTGKGHGQHGK